MKDRYILALYLEEGKTLQDIGEMCGVSRETVRKKLLFYKDEINKSMQRKKNQALKLLELNCSIKEIGKIVNLSIRTIQKISKENKIMEYVDIENVYGEKTEVIKRKQKLCERFIPNRNYTTLTIREIEKILYKLGIK